MAEIRQRLCQTKDVRQEKGVKVALFSFLVVLSQALIGCVNSSTSPSTSPILLASGSITLSNTVPEKTPASDIPTLGFTSSNIGRDGAWLLVNREEQKISLMENAKVLEAHSGKGLELLPVGVYQIIHKQRNPLWYAPDSYFHARRITTPPQGDKSRYFRGALGDFALFIAKDLPVHSGPVWIPEIGGVQLDENSLSKFYYSLPIGAVVEVK